MDDLAISRGDVDDDASRDNASDSTETADGSFADADDSSSIGGNTAGRAFTGKLSRDKAKSLSKLPFADKQQLVREMFARREQGGKAALTIPKDNAGTSTSELDEKDGLGASGRGSANKIKRRGVPLPGLGGMDEDGESLDASGSRRRGRKLPVKPDSDPDDDAAGESRTRPRSASPGKPRGKRIPLKSGDEPRPSANSKAQKPSRSPAKSTSDHRRVQNLAPSNPQQQANSGQSITIRLPSPPTNPPLSVPSVAAAPPLAIPSPYPSPSAATDKLLLRQTVSSFEQCLHHALDMNTALLAQVTKQQAHPPSAFMPNLIAPAPAAPPATRSPQRPPTYPLLVSDAQQAAQRATEYAQGLHKIQELIGKVQATTARHAKAMDAMVEAVNAERERRAADEVKGLVAQLAGGVGYRGSGNAGRSG